MTTGKKYHRPTTRVLTDEQVKLILAWHESVRAWTAQRKTVKYYPSAWANCVCRHRRLMA